MTLVPRRRVILAALLGLAGCSGILPQPAPPPHLYRLTAATDFPAGPVAPVQLVVDLPGAEAALDTVRIALARSPTTLDYYADSAWTDRLSGMVQAAVIQSFDNAHRLAAVGAQTGALRADAVLITELRRFEAVYGAAGPPSWHIEITAKLVKASDRNLLASTSLAGQEQAAKNDMPAIVDAADAAWRRVAKDLVLWTVANVPRPPR